jgi:hypothetical protein
VDGSIPGAIGGILAGVLVPIVVGIWFTEPFGDVASRVLLGFVCGFAGGTFLGGLMGIAGRRRNRDFRIKTGFPIFVCGSVIGSMVVWTVEPLQWLPLGAAIGAVGANLWTILCSWVEATALRPDPNTLEEDSLRNGDRSPYQPQSRQTTGLSPEERFPRMNRSDAAGE